MTPSVAVTPAVSSVNVSFDIPIEAASFTPADVSITGPGGAIPATGVALVGGTTWRVSFAAQSTDGTYTVKVGPAINEVAANLPGMDQNGDGLGGDGTNDVFTGTFVIDGSAPTVVTAYGLQNGNRIGLTFNEALNPAFATNAANYTVPSVVVSNAVLQVDGRSVVLWVSPMVGDSFALTVNSVSDVLGNTANLNFTGTFLPLEPRDIGLSSDPREAGSTVPLSPSDFDITAGGHDIWSSSDGFHYLFERRSGDFDVAGKFESYQGYRYLQTGIMFRENLTNGSPHFFWSIEPDSGYYWWSRGCQNCGTSYSGMQSGSGNSNVWLRLKREGSVFALYRGTNGVDWVQLGRITNSLGTTGYVGLATSRNTTDTSTNVIVRYRGYTELTPAILAQPQSQSVTSSVDVVFSVVARGLPNLGYQWLWNGLPLSGATSNLLFLPSVTLSNVGDYRVVITNAYGAVTSQVASLTVDGRGLGGLEGDVSPRPLGNNNTSVADWVQVGRFVAGLDSVINSGEFQRADCAPRSTGGNGYLSVADWTQAGRYAAGLDPNVPASGPTEPASGGAKAMLAMRAAATDRVLRVVSQTTRRGSEVEVPVMLFSEGNENAVGFSLTFDPAQLQYLGVLAGSGAANASLQVNARSVSSGRFGLALANPTGQSFTAGTQEVARLRFLVVGSVSNAPVRFDDAPVLREIVDELATTLPAAFVEGAVQVILPPHFAGLESLPAGGIRLSLTGAAGDRCAVEVSPDLIQWTSISTNVLGSGPQWFADPDAPAHNRRFYRLRWLP